MARRKNKEVGYPITVEDKEKPDREEKVVDPGMYMWQYMYKTPLPVGFFVIEICPDKKEE